MNEERKNIFAHDMYEKMLAKPLIYDILHTQSVKRAQGRCAECFD